MNPKEGAPTAALELWTVEAAEPAAPVATVYTEPPKLVTTPPALPASVIAWPPALVTTVKACPPTAGRECVSISNEEIQKKVPTCNGLEDASSDACDVTADTRSHGRY